MRLLRLIPCYQLSSPCTLSLSVDPNEYTPASDITATALITQNLNICDSLKVFALVPVIRKSGSFI